MKMIPEQENLIPFSSQFDYQLPERLLFYRLLFYSMSSELSNEHILTFFLAHLKMSVEISKKESFIAVLFLV